MSEELIAIVSGALTARINPLGAELWSLTDERGREYMTDADPAFWTGHAPLLFPIVGALKDGHYRLDGAEYALPKHGFARHSRFEVREAASDRAVFRLGASRLDLVEIAPGLDLERDVVAHMDFRPDVSRVGLMAQEVFR